MCDSKLHLSENDKRFLKSLRIQSWECPRCRIPQLRVEKPNGELNGED